MPRTRPGSRAAAAEDDRSLQQGDPVLTFEGGLIDGSTIPLDRAREYHDDDKHTGQYGHPGGIVMGAPSYELGGVTVWQRYVIDRKRPTVAVYDGDVDPPANFTE